MKLSLYLWWRHTGGGRQAYLHSFLNSALDGRSGRPHNPATVTLKDKAHGTQQIEGWVGPSAGLEVLDNTRVFFLVTKPWILTHFSSTVLGVLSSLALGLLTPQGTPATVEWGRTHLEYKIWWNFRNANSFLCLISHNVTMTWYSEWVTLCTVLSHDGHLRSATCSVCFHVEKVHDNN